MVSCDTWCSRRPGKYASATQQSAPATTAIGACLPRCAPSFGSPPVYRSWGDGPIPGSLVGLTRPIAFLATVALDLAADGGWCAPKSRRNRTNRLTRHHSTRYFFSFSQSQRQSRTASLRRPYPTSLWPEYVVPMSGFDQTTGRYAGGTHPFCQRSHISAFWLSV